MPIARHEKPKRRLLLLALFGIASCATWALGHDRRMRAPQTRKMRHRHQGANRCQMLREGCEARWGHNGRPSVPDSLIPNLAKRTPVPRPCRSDGPVVVAKCFQEV
jgi:hypothetical protein